MKRLLTPGLLCLGLLLFPRLATADCAAPKTIQELRDCWQQFWNQKDAGSIANLYSKDATLVTSDGLSSGHDRIKDELQRLMGTGTITVTLTTNAHAEPTDHGYGYDSGQYLANITPPAGNQSQAQGFYLMVAQKEDGRIVIVRHALVKFTSSPPAPCPQCFA